MLVKEFFFSIDVTMNFEYITIDPEMAQSAIRNLHDFEFNGRSLRVDKASTQADELRLFHQQTATSQPTFDNVPSANITPDKVPEVITRTLSK